MPSDFSSFMLDSASSNSFLVSSSSKIDLYLDFPTNLNQSWRSLYPNQSTWMRYLTHDVSTWVFPLSFLKEVVD